MKKSGKVKKSRASHELPDLVSVMAKFLERIESVEKKTDYLTSRVASLPSELRQIVQNVRPSAPQAPSVPQGPRLENGPREKILHEAVCADCRKNCKVPFRPSGERPVYCPECWAIRKAGHVPKDLISGIKIPNFPKPPVALAPQPSKKRAPSGKKKAKPSKRKK